MIVDLKAKMQLSIPSIHCNYVFSPQERRRRSHAEVQLQSFKSDLDNARKVLDERSGKAQRFDSVLSERDRQDFVLFLSFSRTWAEDCLLL